METSVKKVRIFRIAKVVLIYYLIYFFKVQMANSQRRLSNLFFIIVSFMKYSIQLLIYNQSTLSLKPHIKIDYELSQKSDYYNLNYPSLLAPPAIHTDFVINGLTTSFNQRSIFMTAACSVHSMEFIAILL